MAGENQADDRILAGVEIPAPGEKPMSVEILAGLEKQAASLLFRLGGNSNCWLLPGPADEHVLLLIDVMNLACSLQVRRELLLPCFYGLFPILYRLFVPAHHAKKWPKSTQQPKVWLPPGIPLISVKSQQFLTRLISALSLSRKNLHNHHCCPMSATILTTSKLEAILKIYRGSLKTVQKGRIIWGGGGGLPGTSPPAQAVGAQVTSGHVPGDILSTCHSSVSFSFSTFLCVAVSWAGVDKKYSHYWCRTLVFSIYIMKFQ